MDDQCRANKSREGFRHDVYLRIGSRGLDMKGFGGRGDFEVRFTWQRGYGRGFRTWLG